MDGHGVIDIFAGPGGWDEGMALLGRRDVVGVEWDRVACDIARAAGHVRVQDDVSAVDPESFADVHGWTGEGLLASPPCQGFSMAGSGIGRSDLSAVLRAIYQVKAGRDIYEVVQELSETSVDKRSTLVLEPLLWTLVLRPRRTALGTGATRPTYLEGLF